jgi:hypothetical protein
VVVDVYGRRSRTMMMICHVFLNVIITMGDDSGGHGLGDDILVEVIDILLFFKKNTIFLLILFSPALAMIKITFNFYHRYAFNSYYFSINFNQIFRK